MKKLAILSILSLGFGAGIAEPALARDTTPPVITAIVDGTLGTNGWYTSNVGLTWTVADPESARIRKYGCGTVSRATDTSGTTYTCRATSAGGTSSESMTIKRDATLPGATITVPANGATYAFGQTVLASYSCSDATSRVATCVAPVSNGSAIDTGSGGSKTFAVTATDNAGNVKVTTVTYSVVDTTPPVITPTVGGTLGNNGWYVSTVNVNWSVTDAESTIGAQTGCGPASISVDTSASGTTLTCSATSAGGSTIQSATIKRDATLPTVTIATPASGAAFTLNQPVNASFVCSDAPSGIATCTGTVANGVAINTSSAGTKTFTVTAIDQAGNLTTRDVSYSVTSPTSFGAAGTRLFAWNDLGMHCMDTDYETFTLLPPFNDLNAQLMVNGKLVNAADYKNYTLEYQSVSDPTGSVNTYSDGPIKKTNFWDNVLGLFGFSLTPNAGMTGNPTPSTTPAPLEWFAADSWFEASGIPITPTDDAGKFKPYPMVKVTAKNGSGQVLASTNTVLPVSTEMNCKGCHASVIGSDAAKPSGTPTAGGWVNQVATDTERDWRVNVLRLHDQKNAGWSGIVKVNNVDTTLTYAELATLKGYGTSLEGSVNNSPPKPIFCDTCHNSNALAIWGLGGAAGVSNMSAAMHSRHANARDPSGKTLDSDPTREACYSCHPGKETQCLRGAMGNPVGSDGKHLIECQACHGSMSVVGKGLIYDPFKSAYRPRDPWVDMPTCQTCHQNGQRDNVALTINSNGSFAYKPSTDQRFATNANTPFINGFSNLSLYRFSVGHGNLQCAACHNSTHAEFTGKTADNSVNDGVRAIEAQGYVAAIRECTACHATVPRSAKGGPHGMHYIGQSWVTDHHDVVTSSNKGDCLYCHGSTSAGSDLAVIKIAKTFNIGDRRTRSFAATTEERVTCWSCHNGPMR